MPLTLTEINIRNESMILFFVVKSRFGFFTCFMVTVDLELVKNPFIDLYENTNVRAYRSEKVDSFPICKENLKTRY